MATGKRYFWIKLKESFMNSDTVDYLMSQPDGANYVVLYQMLCLKTINTDGRLSRQIGEIIIPYDVEKIQRDCKYFSADTIRVALKLFQSFGLIYEDVDGTLVLTDHQNLVGSETDYARQKQVQRKNTPALPPVDTGVDNVHENVHTEIDIRDRDRDKRLEIRDKDTRDKRKKADAFSALASDDPDLLKALRDFEQMRKSIKKPLSDRAKSMLVTKLEAFPREQWIAILEQSIFHNWQGVFPLHDAETEPRVKRTPMDDLRTLHDMFEEDGE